MGGYGFGEVLAVAGDHVRFGETAYEINGVPRSLLPDMPTSGEIVMGEKTWFIWPDITVGGGHGYVGIPRSLRPCCRWRRLRNSNSLETFQTLVWAKAGGSLSRKSSSQTRGA